MQKWEYAVLSHDMDGWKQPQWNFSIGGTIEHGGEASMLQLLNQYGLDGWEAVCPVPSEPGQMLLKRPKQ
jgi:hypothetical protein